MFHKMQEKINETRQQTTSAAAAAASSSSVTNTLPKSSPYNCDGFTQNDKDRVLQGTVKSSHVTAPPSTQNALFSLGDNDE